MTSRRRTSFAPNLFNAKVEPIKIAEAPTDPLPVEGSKPSDVLINRLHEIKRISKSLSGYFEGLASAHVQQASTILKLSATSILQTPFPESSLFLPSPLPKGFNGHSGWAELILNLRDETKDGAERHAEIGRILSKQVVVPLKKMRVDIKAHISMMEKEITKLSDSVLKERDTTNHALNSLTKSVSISTPTIPLSSADDPFLLKSATEAQMKVLIAKENELLKLVLLWQERSFALEKETWQRITACWKIYEVANSNLLLSSQQHSVLLSANVDSIPPEAEWNFFLKLNHIIPLNTPLKSETGIDYPHRNDPATVSSKEGLLERQKRFTKSWKSAFFILTPSGHLHEYATSAAPLSKPYLSLALASCTLGPMPTPEANVKGRALEPCFTIEAPDGRSIFKARSWEELSSWWLEIEKFTISTLPPEAPQSPLSPRGEGVFETNLYPAVDLDEKHLRSSPSSPSALHPLNNRRSSDHSIQSFQSADSASSGDLGSTGLHSLPIPVPLPTPNSKKRVPVPSPLAPNRPASPIRIVLRPVPPPPSSSSGGGGGLGFDGIKSGDASSGGGGGGGGGGSGHGNSTGSANFGEVDLMDESQWPVSPERKSSGGGGGMGRRVDSSGSVEGGLLGFGGAERIPLPNSPTSI